MAKPSARFFFVRRDGQYVKIDFADIRYVEACRNYIRIVTMGAVYQILATLGCMGSALPPEEFIRIHRSFLIAIGQVTAFDNHHVSIAGKQLPIGDFYRKNLTPFILIVR